jgi:CBS domain-containing protein
MHPDAALPTFRLDRGTTLAQAQPTDNAPVTLASPALAVMTDLTKVKAATTHPRTTLRQAEQAMIYQGVRMLFVVTQMPLIEGLITATDLGGDKQMRVVHERHLHYDELCVADVMTELGALDAIDYAVVRSAAVGNAVATLQRLGRNHLLVVEASTAQTPRRVRGVISRSQVERQLGRPIDITPIANSFSEIERALV